MSRQVFVRLIQPIMFNVDEPAPSVLPEGTILRFLHWEDTDSIMVETLDGARSFLLMFDEYVFCSM